MVKVKHSEIINSVQWCLMKQDQTEVLRDIIRSFCHEKKYTGALLNLYNKTYIFIDSALFEYMETNLPKKYLVDLWHYIKSE
jgi:hypothetical protein